MPIRILVADDSPFMLSAVRRLLQEEPRIRVVGETSAFSTIMQTIVDFKPEVLLFDCTWWRNEISHPLSSKSQLGSVSHALAMSFANDEEAKALAERYGVALLEKMNLFTEQVSSVTRTRRPHTVRDATPTQSPM
jgi:DNA-binding NarL/FixJ family response regulator